MYPSDYGYATDFNICNKILYNYNDNTDVNSCRNNDWIYNGYDWLLSSSTERTYLPTFIHTYGNLRLGTPGSHCADGAKDVRPTLFLNSNVMIIDGIGTETSPYQLSIE